MSSTTFVNGVTLTDSDWFQDVDRLHYTIFGDPASGAAGFYNVINALTADSSPDTAADYVVTLDASASTAKKVALNNIISSATASTIVIGTPVTASGTTVDFTGIPSWARRITVNLIVLSTTGTDSLVIQLGDSGGIEATGYLCTAATVATGVTIGTQFSIGFGVINGSAGALFSGTVILELVNAATFLWCASGVIGRSDSAIVHSLGGSKATSAATDRLRVTTVSGVDTFDAGVVNITYQ